jgi:hypothetical protein
VLDPRLAALLCRIIIVAKTKRVKTGWSTSRRIWQNVLRKVEARKGGYIDIDDHDGDGDSHNERPLVTEER